MTLGGLFMYLTDPNNFTFATKQFGSATILNGIIGILNQAMVTFLSQLFLMSAAVTKWPNLVRVLCDMERDQFFQQKNFKSFRVFFVTGLALLIAVLMKFDDIVVLASAQHIV